MPHCQRCGAMYGIYIEGGGVPLHVEDECTAFQRLTEEQRKKLWDVYRIEFKPLDQTKEGM